MMCAVTGAKGGTIVRGRLVSAAAGVGVVVALAAPWGTAANAAGSHGQSLCIGHHPQDFVWYTASCTGHDEPEIDPLSNKAGSAQDLTWTVVLPTDGAVQVDSVGPTFWIGGTVSDPNSLFNQAFLELQFYPNSITTGCNHGTLFCYYPSYSFNGAHDAFTYGGDYPGTTKDFGQALEFQQQEN